MFYLTFIYTGSPIETQCLIYKRDLFQTLTLMCAYSAQEKTVEISVRLSPKQLDHVTPVLEEIIHEITQERQKSI